MNVEVNWLAIVLATASSMVVGSVWYAKPVFGNIWMKLIGKKEKDLNQRATVAIGGTIIVSFVTAFVLAHVAFLSNQYFDNSFLQDTMSTAFWLWLGFTAARFITHDLFEHRPVRLTIMNITHELITVIVMAAIIGSMAP
jgi:hypothetical protein